MPERRPTRGAGRWHALAPPPGEPGRPASSDDTAARLLRLLAILPAAARRGESALSELAEELDLDETTVAEDLRAVAERHDEEPEGGEAPIQILLEGDRVYVYTTAEFSRPVRLTPPEALALAMGLRLAALSPGARDESRREALRARLERELSGLPAEDLSQAFEAPDLGTDAEGIREVILHAVRERRRCTIRYLKADAFEPEERAIEPRHAVHAEGHWYVLAQGSGAETTRLYRMDRILAARVEGGVFQVREDFDPEVYLQAGRVFRADEHVEAVVRYAPPIARWVAETTNGEYEEDGSLLARHHVADPDWLIRHVLRHGGDAEVLEPADLRRRVAEEAARVAATHA